MSGVRRADDDGRRLYTWTGAGKLEEFYSVTTILGQGIPKYLVPWALCRGDRCRRGPGVTTAIKPTWRAAKDGIGHAVIKPAAFNAVCGKRAVLERLSWPVTDHCRLCESILGTPS